MNLQFTQITREEPPEWPCDECGGPFEQSGNPPCASWVEAPTEDERGILLHPRCYLVWKFRKGIPENLCDTMVSEHS